MPAKKLKAFLDAKKAKYIAVSHAPAYTAQEIAALAHIPGKNLAKTVVVKLDGTMAMAVMPASRAVDFELLKKVSGAAKAELASEDEFRDVFPECELGAMPPFGNLYDMSVYVDERLAEDEVIAFNAGSHKELFRMTYEDFAALVKPKVADFGR